jgi:hypothetical protein
MLRVYLSKKLTRPLPTKDGGTLRTVAEARAYMVALPKDRELSARWQRAAELLLAEADALKPDKTAKLWGKATQYRRENDSMYETFRMPIINPREAGLPGCRFDVNPSR